MRKYNAHHGVLGSEGVSDDERVGLIGSNGVLGDKSGGVSGKKGVLGNEGVYGGDGV